MTRHQAIATLAATACFALLLSGAAGVVLPFGCLVLILFDLTVLAPRRRVVPAALLVGLQAGLAAVFLYLALLRDPPVEFLTLLLTFGGPFLLFRTFHPESEFNEFLILLVSLLLVVGSAAVAPGLLPVAITALYVLVACHALAALARRQAQPQGDVRFRLSRSPGWWAAVPAITAHHLAVGGLILGALLYLVAPRPDLTIGDYEGPERLAGQGDPRRGGSTGSTRTGFPRDVRLGDVGRIKKKPFLALKVDIRRRGRPYDPTAEERSLLLLRARAWEDYVPERARWLRPRATPRPLHGSGVIEPGDTEFDWSFEVLGYDGLTLFLPQRARRVRGAGRPLAIDRLGIVTARSPVEVYGVSSAAPVPESELYRLRPDTGETRLLRVPDAAVRVLLPRLPAAPRGNLAAAASAVADFFRVNDFRYTLDLPAEIQSAPDPLAAFLERREGHCELYATTACLFLRMLGVPARVAGGLRGAERLDTGKYQARFANAHAWVEVPCVGFGFVPLDFTPPDATAARPAEAGGETTAADPEQPAAGAAALDWSDPFAYGPEEQERVLGWIEEQVSSWPALAVAGVFLLLIFVPAVLSAVRNRPRSPLRVTAPAGQRRKTLAFYAQWLKACAAKGHVRSRIQTPREFLAALPPELRAAGEGVTSEFERRRYGG